MADEAPRDEATLEAHLATVYVNGAKPTSGPIVLVPYDPNWPSLFEHEATRIREALGDRARVLEHAGSTSVPGLHAKPIIDIVLCVPDSADEPAYVPDLESRGYKLTIREPDWFQHRVFKGPDTNVNLHVFTIDCPEAKRMLAFRDNLRENDADRALYAETKRTLATREWKYVQAYADAKGSVVKDIMSRMR